MTARQVTGWPVGTIVRGRRVMWEGEIVEAAQGEPVLFSEALPQLALVLRFRQRPGGSSGAQRLRVRLRTWRIAHSQGRESTAYARSTAPSR